MVIPFKRAVEANGEPFNIYVSPSFFNGGSSGAAPSWLLNNPGEYADYSDASLQRNGFALRNYVTLAAYAAAIEHILQPETDRVR